MSRVLNLARSSSVDFWSELLEATAARSSIVADWGGWNVAGRSLGSVVDLRRSAGRMVGVVGGRRSAGSAPST